MFWKKKDEARSKAPVAQPAAQPAAQAPSSAAQPAPAEPQPAAAASPATVHPHPAQQAMSSALAMQFGKVASVLMFSPRHQAMSLKDIAAAVLPAVAANQFVVAEARQKGSAGNPDVTAPVGLLLWARVSDEVDHRFSADATKPTQLSAAEWTSGDNYWVIESVGAPKVVEAMMKELMEGPFKGRVMKFRWTGADGRPQIQTYDLRAA